MNEHNDRFFFQGNPKIWIFGGIFFAILLPTIFLAGYLQTETHTGCVVKEKHRTTTQVETTCGHFQTSSDFGRLIFNDQERFAQLQVGETYDLVTAGWNYRRANTYPNIIEIIPVGDETVEQ